MLPMAHLCKAEREREGMDGGPARVGKKMRENLVRGERAPAVPGGLEPPGTGRRAGTTPLLPVCVCHTYTGPPSSSTP